MTVSSASSRISYTGNASTTAFAFPYQFGDTTDLKVYQNGTLKTITTHYTVSGGSGLSGTVTFLTAPAAGDSVVIYDDPPVTQLADYIENDNFPAETHEGALDKLTRIARRQKSLLERSFRLPDSYAGSASTELPIPEADTFLTWNDTASALVNRTAEELVTLAAFAAWHSQAFSGNGVTVTFTPSTDPANVNNMDVSVGGVPQRNGIDFTLAAGVITFTSPPPVGTNNIFVRWGEALPEGTSTLQAHLASAAGITEGVSMLGINMGLGYTTGLGLFLGYTYARTAVEVSAGVTPTNYAYLPGDPLRYGAVGNSNGTAGVGTDDTAVFRLLKALGNAGQKAFYLRGRRYRLATIADSEQLLDIASNDGMTWYMDGAEFVVDRTFTGSVQCGVFQFTACKNVTFVGGVKATCTQSQPANQHTSRGPRFVQLLQGSHNFKADSTYFTDFREGYHAIRNSTDPRSYISRNPDFGVIYAYRTGYPCSGSLSGHGAKGVIYAEEAGRSCFWTGIDAADFTVVTKNHEASVNCLVATDPCNDSGSLKGDGPKFKVRYFDTESTVADNSLNHIDLQVQNSELYISRFANVDIEFYIENPSAGAWTGFAFAFSKVTSAGAGDAVDRGHIYENIRISGTVKAASANQRSCQTQRLGTWGATLDTFRNITFERILFDSTGQPNIILTPLKDIAVMRGIVSTATFNVTASTNTGSRVDAYDNSVNAWAVTGGNFYNRDETDVTVTYSASMTLDAATGKRFVITATNGTAFAIAWSNFCKGDSKKITIRNGSGGALGAITFTGMKTTFTAPANNFNRSLELTYDGSNAIQTGGTFADIPN